MIKSFKYRETKKVFRREHTRKHPPGIQRQAQKKLYLLDASMSLDTAIRLACYFGTSPQFWMNLQGRYDLDVAEDQHADQIKKEVHPCAA